MKPIQGTPFTESPEVEDYAWWIAQTRIQFPKLEIMAGLTPRKAEDYADIILKAGANAITKFPAVRKFGSEQAVTVENKIKSVREFNSTLTTLPDVDWENEVNKLSFEPELKESISGKINEYIKKMKKRKV